MEFPKEDPKEDPPKDPKEEPPKDPKEEPKMSKKQENKEKRKAEKLKKAMEQKEKELKVEEDDPCKTKYGDLPLNRSQGDPEDRYKIKYTPIKEIEEKLVGAPSLHVRGRVHNSRVTGKGAFIVLRESFTSIQCVMFVGESISKTMVKFAKGISRESIVDVVGQVVVPEVPVESCTQKVEIQIEELWVVNRSLPQLPFQLEDAMRKVVDQSEEEGPKKPLGDLGKEEKKSKGGKEKLKQETRVLQDTRMDFRILDLRIPTNQAIMRIQGGVCRYFREFLYTKDFVEIHSPKIIPGTSEGGCEVFKLQYFGREACLAQSPQLYKQMCICGDMDKIFEIAPAFRAENSNTNRHLCEFTMLDVEMAFKNHYFEVLDLLGELWNYVFEKLAENYAKELAIINEQYPFTPFKCISPALKLNFKEGIKMLEEVKYAPDPLADLSSEHEKALGELVREKYNTDFYMLYGYPISARPFYTMLDPVDPRYTNSYDFFMRGEEITSGAQRIHDPKMLEQSAINYQIPVESIKDYINSFQYGCPPHGGMGVGLERVVKLFCGIHNIRKCILFTRDPKRLTP